MSNQPIHIIHSSETELRIAVDQRGLEMLKKLIDEVEKSPRATLSTATHAYGQFVISLSLNNTSEPPSCPANSL